MSRSKFLKIALLLAVSVIAVRLFVIQIVQHDEWQAMADEQHTLENTIVAKRGEIYMMDGGEPTAVVMNETVYTVIVDPMLADEEETRKVVDGNARANEVAEWEDVFSDKTRRYYIVAKNVKRTAAEKIRAAELTGVWFQENTKRVYAEGQMASGLLGFVNSDGIGQYGVEGALNKDLAGENGLLKTVSDVNNVALSIGGDNIRKPAVDGTDVVLTVDRNIQKAAEDALAKNAEKYKTSNASAIVMNPNTGEILAMANYPTYDPANFGYVKDASAYVNYVAEVPYEPASVCKTFAFAAAIDLGVMTANTTYTNTGATIVDTLPVKNLAQNASLRGKITMQKAFNWSLNTGSTQALRLMSGSTTEITAQGRELLYEYYYNRFGLGQYTGVELIESPGLLVEPHADMYTLNKIYADMTYGQNLQITMLQTAAAFASVVNGGKYYTPTIVAGKMENGRFVKKELAEAVRQTVSESTSAAMRKMLVGTRTAQKDKKGYTIGGKTGTAQKIVNGVYSDTDAEGSYIGFGGASGEMPQYVIMTHVWNEKGSTDATQARLIFDEMSNFMIKYLRIKPGE